MDVETIMSSISTILNVQVLPRTAARSTDTTSAVTQLLAALWRASVLTAGQHALPRAGEKVSSHGLAVRGRLDIAATARRRATGHRELVSARVVRTYDNAPARAVVLADRYFDQRLVGANWRGARLDEQLAALRTATGTRPQIPTLHEIRTARYSPITIKWRRAAELSWRILNRDPLGGAADSESTHGILIDVAELWELFVLHCVGLATDQVVRHGTTTRTAGHLARSAVDPHRTMGRLYPDVVVGEDPITAVIDAKYKRLWR
ncbi:5-methylcytosine restriction system specificity protein McrC [Rhodococcus erythropolis]|uniref:5-methylcytosine restriction system specificity protein McrC n=1 Tax=Rhodococcus erythropolis TaxID=1833 RepID=UPI0039182FAD